MINKIHSASSISDNKVMPIVSKTEAKADAALFASNNGRANVDEIRISNKNSDVISEEKSNKRKKWLIGAGIALGVLAVGIAAAYLVKRTPGFLSGGNTKIKLGELENAVGTVANTGESTASTVALSFDEAFAEVSSFPQRIINKNGIELRNMGGGQYFIYDSAGKRVGDCTLEDGISGMVTRFLDGTPQSWIEGIEMKPFLEIDSILVTSKKR